MNIKEGFDVYDELPEDMIAYLRYNGRHFNRRLVKFATSKMTTRDSNGTEVPLEPISKDKARDERIAGIETEVAGIKGDIAKILAAVTKQ